jgi:vitamin B12 transporter
VPCQELIVITGLTARHGFSGALFVCLVASPQFSRADEPSADSPVVVTASRVPESTADSVWSTTVLTRQDIQSRQVSSVQDLLADLAGVNIDNAGGPGKASSIFLRGTNADHTLLLINGQRVGSATLGTPPFELIPLEMIDHIELVRGPRATLYGSDAMGGVIQIFTRRPQKDGLTFGASAMDGSYDTHEFTANLQAKGEHVWASLGGDSFMTRGFDTCLPNAPPDLTGCTDSRDPDGFHNHSGVVTAGAQLGDRLAAEVDSLLADGWTNINSSFINRTAFTEHVTSIHLDGLITESWHARLVAGRDVDVQKNLFDGTPQGRFDSRRDNASLQLDGQLASALRLVSGVDYERDHVDSDTAYAVTSRDTKGVFTELHAEAGGWTGIVGGRYDNNEQFGHHLTETLGVARKLAGDTRLSATWGTAFHAPTFNELYYPGFGNPTLQPEESRSFELGADGARGALNWSLHVYQTTIDRLIAYSFDPATGLYLPQNVDRARVRGAELQADWHNAAWKIGGQVTALDPRNRSNDTNNDNLLPRRAKESGAVEVRRFIPGSGFLALDSGSIGVVGRWEGRRYDDVANTFALGGYLTMDVLTEWTFARDWKLEANAANLFDRNYQTAAYFAQAGRHYGVTIRYQTGAK